MRRPWWIPAVVVVLHAAAAAPLPELWRALAGVPAVWLLPGLPWAMAAHRALPARVLWAFAISAGAGIAGVLLARLSDTRAVLPLVSSLVALAGMFPPSLPARPLAVTPRVALAGVVVSVLLTGWAWRDTLARPLDGHWWLAAIDEGAWEGAATPPGRGAGWGTRQEVGSALALRPRTDRPFLLGPAEGVMTFVFRGRVGATVEVGGELLTVQRAPVEDPEEGPVLRYLDRGSVGFQLDLDLDAGERLDFVFSDPAGSRLYVLPTPDSVWELHGTGVLRFVHYYQLLNMVEQVAWARELGVSRWVTDVQPPLWSWLLAGPLLATEGELPTVNVALLGLLLVVGAAWVLALDAVAPRAPLLAALLPGLALAVHAKLLLEPGSGGMPDTLYVLGVLVAAAGVVRGGTAGVVAGGLVAQLARYPGTLLAGLLAAWGGRWRELRALLVAVALTVAVVGVAGLGSGALPGWIETAWFETFFEHWHGETDPAALLPRVPVFLYLWFAYAGGAPLLALLRRPPATRALLGAAFTYAALLATVDHFPSHYFLPLLHLSVLAVVSTAEAIDARRTRSLLLLVAAGGLWTSITVVPVTG